MKIDTTYIVTPAGKVPEPQATLIREFHLKNIGKRIDSSFGNHVNKATNPQKRYFFGVVFRMISEYMEASGEYHTPDELYDFYKNKGYFGYTEIMGEPTPKGLSKASTEETNLAKERVQREWAERGLVIPDPNQKDFLDEPDN